MSRRFDLNSPLVVLKSDVDDSPRGSRTGSRGSGVATLPSLPPPPPPPPTMSPRAGSGVMTPRGSDDGLSPMPFLPNPPSARGPASEDAMSTVSSMSPRKARGGKQQSRGARLSSSNAKEAPPMEAITTQALKLIDTRSSSTMEDFDRFLAGEEGKLDTCPSTEELDVAAATLPTGQRHKLETLLQERAKLLNKFFEEQLRKQYEAMKREVGKLAKQHQKDVHSLDERFKGKMLALAQRFKALEAEEARTAMIRQENHELQKEVETLKSVTAEYAAQQKGAEAAMRAKESEMEDLGARLAAMADKESELQETISKRRAAMAEAEGVMQDKMGQLSRQLFTKKHELDEMKGRMRGAKSQYDGEMLRKHQEITELEGSMGMLQDYNTRMRTMIAQVQTQIRQRETDMRTQLALLKHTIAFALYIDETLAIDLTDPHTMVILAHPVTVMPSGVTYSATTVDKLVADAKKLNKQPLCPQSSQPITGQVPNTAMASILSRYLFKQQVTKDVLEALREFTRASGMDDEQQPLEAYMQRMKENMVERLQKLHVEQMARSAQEYEEKIERGALEASSHERSAAELKDELSAAQQASLKHKVDASEERDILEEKLQFARGELKVVAAERDRLLAHRDQLLSRLANVQSHISRVDEDTEADTDALDAEPSNPKLEKLRKQDMLALRAELDGAKAALAKEKERATAQFQELGARGAECDSLRQQLAVNTKLVASVTEENSNLHTRVKELTAEAAGLDEQLRSVSAARTKLSNENATLQSDSEAQAATLRERGHQLGQLGDDTSRLRARLDDKTAKVREQTLELAQLRVRLEESTADASRRERQLSILRDELMEAKHKGGEAGTRAAWLQSEVERLGGVIERRDGELVSLRGETAAGHAQLKQLQMRLDAAGIKEAESSLDMSDMATVKEQAGVYDPIGGLPKVEVLDTLLSTLSDASREISELTSSKLQAMRKVNELPLQREAPEGADGDAPSEPPSDGEPGPSAHEAPHAATCPSLAMPAQT